MSSVQFPESREVYISEGINKTFPSQSRAKTFSDTCESLNPERKQPTCWDIFVGGLKWLWQKIVSFFSCRKSSPEKIESQSQPIQNIFCCTPKEIAPDNTKPINSECEAAVKIQALFRGHQARKMLRETREKEEALQASKIKNITKIQALVRGRQARKVHREAQETALQLSRVENITTIQALFRGRQARKMFKAKEKKSLRQRAIELAPQAFVPTCKAIGLDAGPTAGAITNGATAVHFLRNGNMKLAGWAAFQAVGHAINATVKLWSPGEARRM